MLFDTTNTLDTMPTMPPQSQNATNFSNFHSRVNQQPQIRVPQFQKNDVRSTRRYSSGTPTMHQQQQNAYTLQMTQSMNSGAGRRVANKGTYRSATFHQPNTDSFPTYRQSPQLNQQPGNQLRTSSSFHGCIQQTQQPQQLAYTGRNNYAGSQPQSKPSMYAGGGAFHPGMKDVPIWLKSLRLHKYTRMFQEMPYNEMMALDDQKLEERQVTKGARKKILQSLDKLRDRSQLIRQLEKCIDELGDVRCLIVELRAMMNTPIAAYKPNGRDESKSTNYVIDAIGIPAAEVTDENLPGHIARLCIRLHEFLFRNGLPKIQELGIEDEYLVNLLQVYDKILSNEAFTYRQRYCIYECKRVMSRYMLEQKILGQNLVTPYAQQSTQPTMVSSPSSGYHTMSPPSSSTRRNSDTKESVDDLTATTTATNSDDDFHVSNSAPSSPPAQFLCRNLAYTQPNQRRHSPEEQWSQQQTQQPPTQCPPGFEWLQSASAGASVSQQPRPTAAAHFQPYVNDQFMSIGTATPVTPQQRPNGWYTQQQESVSYPNANGLPQQQQSRANQWDQRQLDVEKSNLSSVFNSNPALCDYLVQQLQHQQRQTVNSVKPPKAPSPIGTRPSNYMPQTKEQNADSLMTINDKLRFLASDANGPQILDLAVQIMKMKSQKPNNAQQQQNMQSPLLWQNIKDQPPKQQTQAVPQQQQQSNWWPNPTTMKQSTKPALYSSNDQQRQLASNHFEKKHDLYDLWMPATTTSQHHDLSDQLTASTASTTTSDANPFNSTNVKPPQQQPSPLLDANLLTRMLNDTYICGGQSQQQQRIMRQYALPDDIAPTENRLFNGITRSDDSRNLLNDHQPETLFSIFQPLLYTASGAVH